MKAIVEYFPAHIFDGQFYAVGDENEDLWSLRVIGSNVERSCATITYEDWEPIA